MTSAILNHLWQSTLFTAAAWLLTLALRRNSAAARHSLWVAASLKFLAPFSLVAALGSWFAPAPGPSVAASNAIRAIESVGQPFAAPRSPTREPAPRPGAPLAALELAVWACGSLWLAGRWVARWARVQAAVRSASPFTPYACLRATSSAAFAEPGIFGILRPVLLLPEGIGARLTGDQLRAIVAHELCHVRRRDNLATLLHTFVEVLFWFHPLVWWIGARLVEERERACDEEVIRLGNDPEIYAESILRCCLFYLEMPRPCVSGITGANLASRIVNIMTAPAARALGCGRKLLLASAALCALALPIVYGALSVPVLRAQVQTPPDTPKLEVAAIKPSSGSMRGFAIIPEPGGRLHTANTTLRRLLLAAFHLHDVQLTGGPDWMDRDRFDIEAKAEGNANLSEQQLFGMLGSLVVERFHIQMHHETKQMSVYSLVPAKGGSKLVKSDHPQDPSIRNRRIIDAKGGTIGELADLLGWVMGRPVLDRTGLTGIYQYHLEWTPDESQIQGEVNVVPPAEFDPNAQSIFTAIQDRLGLKLEAGKGPVEILVIDRVERPAQN